MRASPAPTDPAMSGSQSGRPPRHSVGLAGAGAAVRCCVGGAVLVLPTAPGKHQAPLLLFSSGLLYLAPAHLADGCRSGYRAPRARPGTAPLRPVHCWVWLLPRHLDLVSSELWL